jgi:hypothetical protein
MTEWEDRQLEFNVPAWSHLLEHWVTCVGIQYFRPSGAGFLQRKLSLFPRTCSAIGGICDDPNDTRAGFFQSTAVRCCYRAKNFKIFIYRCHWGGYFSEKLVVFHFIFTVHLFIIDLFVPTNALRQFFHCLLYYYDAPISISAVILPSSGGKKTP